MIYQHPPQKKISMALRHYWDNLGMVPRTCIEVGAAHPHSFRLGEFVDMGCKVILIEANPRLCQCLKDGCNDGDFQDTWPAFPPPPYDYQGLAGCPNVQIVNAAITDSKGDARFYEDNASSFVAGVRSPAHQNDGFIEGNDKRYYTVRTTTIDEFDDGQVDILLADVEGCEWHCIERLVSRPRLIVLETHGGDNYLNPHIKEIADWMLTNGYAHAGQNESDTAFLKL